MSAPLLAPAPVPGSRILATGHYLPAGRVTNAEAAARCGVTEEWITTRVGVGSRRVAADGEQVVDMAAAAAAACLAEAELEASEVSVVILATCSMPSPMPAGAGQVAARIGAAGAGAFDVNIACAGFPYALGVADALVRAGTARHVLVVASERMTDWVDPACSHTGPIFADGAGAALVGPSAVPGIGPVVWGSDGARGELVRIPGRDGVVEMAGPRVFRWATTELAGFAEEACKAAGVHPSELAAFVPHQANARIVGALAGQLGVEGAEVSYDIRDTGNTSAASVALALARLRAEGRVAPGARVLLFGFGAGLAWAGQVITCP